MSEDEDIEPSSVAELRASVARGWDPDFLFFWGHTPKARQTHVGRECLSQWYPASFALEGRTFPTAEHMMMYRKAMLFGDHATAERIMSASSPGEAKSLGRAVQGFDEAEWKRARFEIVLVEASPRDAIWGIGLAESSPAARAPDQWRGLNLLGFALMQARRLLAVTPASSEVPR